MPEGSYNLPATACQTGQILAKVEDTPCSGCYALKGRYRFPNVKDALQRRLASLTHPRWVEAMTVLVKKKKHFRWHDSGDIQSVDHLKKIYEVCINTPKTMHWLPTQERRYLPLQGVAAFARRAVNLGQDLASLTGARWYVIGAFRHFAWCAQSACYFVSFLF